jgi:fructokinase
MTLRIVGIGEVLWDLFPSGPQLGGAPANFAAHASTLGAEASIITRVGADARGDEILSRVAGMGVSTACLQLDSSYPTGTVSVEMPDGAEHRFVIAGNVAWDHLTDDANAHSAVALADAVCFGTLAQRSEQSGLAIRSLVAATPPSALRIFDINLRQHFYTRELIERSLTLASVMKLNDAELPVLAEMMHLSGDIRAQLAQLCERWELRAIALTRGAHGAVLHTEHEWSEHPGFPVTVQDTVGAGDAFTAAMSIGLLRGWSLDDVNREANRVAAFVASQTGATPALPPAVRAPFLV